MLTDGKYEYVEYTPKKGTGDKVRDKLIDKGELLEVCKRSGDGNNTYYHIRFKECGHECFIRTGRNLECNHKECVSKRMSQIRRVVFNKPEYRERLKAISHEAQSRPEIKEKHRRFFTEYWGKEENRKAQSEKKKKYFTNEENRKMQSERTRKYFADADNRKKTSESVKVLYANRDYKKKYLETRANDQRKRRNKDEVLFMEMLDELGIEYIWQVPILTDDGKGFIIDFYIPVTNLYVNIDGIIHEKNEKYNNYIADKKIDDDKRLDNYCKEKGLNLCHIKVNDLRSFGFSVKEVINK